MCRRLRRGFYWGVQVVLQCVAIVSGCITAATVLAILYIAGREDEKEIDEIVERQLAKGPFDDSENWTTGVDHE